MLDPRPHLGEPLAVDLLNTRWMTVAGPRDLLSEVDGLRCWLTTNELTDRSRADEPTLRAVLEARAAIEAVLHHGTPGPLNRVLDHGRVRRTLTGEGPAGLPDIPEPAWVPAWLAAADLLDLLAEGRDRIKQCAGPHCILYFYDTSKNGSRRWHSMATCGNRAKAARHHARRP